MNAFPGISDNRLFYLAKLCFACACFGRLLALALAFAAF